MRVIIGQRLSSEWLGILGINFTHLASLDVSRVLSFPAQAWEA